MVKRIPRYGTVINAVPPDERMFELPWEEWYVLDGVLHHHVLHLREPAKYDEIFQAPAHDEVHPPHVLGKRWYVTEDPDMRPMLLRQG